MTDTLGEPISDALVEISGRGPFSSIMLRTSESGEFSIDTLVVGETYTVAVMRFGYRAVETKPFVASATPKLLTMVLRPRRTITMRAQVSQPKAKLIRGDSTSFQPEKAE